MADDPKTKKPLASLGPAAWQAATCLHGCLACETSLESGNEQIGKIATHEIHGGRELAADK